MQSGRSTSSKRRPEAPKLRIHLVNRLSTRQHVATLTVVHYCVSFAKAQPTDVQTLSLVIICVGAGTANVATIQARNV